MNFYDITEHVEEDILPCCPLCDQPMDELEKLAMVKVGEYRGLAHDNCALALFESDEDKD
jgi:hypothetical protein